MIYFLDLLGTLAFAIAGAFKAKGAALNVFGVVFLGIITAVGGGTFRDLIIGRTPLFYLRDHNYLLIAVLGSLATYFLPHVFKKGYSWFRLMDSIGLSAFIIIGTSITKNYIFAASSPFEWMSFLACIFMGMMTGFGGGVIRDAIMGDVPYAFKHGSTYIEAAFIGALIFYILMFININLAIFASILITLVLREIISPYGLYKKVLKNRLSNFKKL